MEKQFKPVPNVECLKYHGTPEKPDIKIFVSHRIDLDSETINNPLFIPVRCGAVYDKRTDVEMLGDDTGDNISEKRQSFCELTVQYWAWKNIQADYYGLCHYRRYLNFSESNYSTDEYGNVCDDFITLDSIKKYCLYEHSIQKVIQGYDIIVSKKTAVDMFPEHFHSVGEQYKQTSYLHGEDLNTVLDVIVELYPEYEKSVMQYLSGTKTSFCNLFIMKKEIFFEYSEWLFNILFEVEKRIDTTNYTIEGYRTPGHLGERLLNIFILFQESKNPNIKIKELQTVFFSNTAKQDTCLVAAFEDKDNTIPIVLAANDFFVPMCATTIASVLSNADLTHNYDIVVLNKDISSRNKSLMLEMCNKFENVRLRFFDIISLLSQYSLKGGMHISVETYYRFLIQDILKDYDKVLYLDSDLVCTHNIAELYDTNLQNNWIGAVKDPDMIGQINGNEKEFNYAIEKLKLQNPHSYFQAGVLLLNVKALRKSHTTKQWLDESMTKYKYMDQDILNKNAQNKVKFLDMRWNVLIDCVGQRLPIIKQAPYNICQEYLSSRKMPYIIHYAGFQKPWNDVSCDFYEEFWEYAKLTPFYERLISILVDSKIGNSVWRIDRLENKVFPYKPSSARQAADKLCPPGSKRRKVAKFFVPPGSWRYKFIKKLYYFFHPIKRKEEQK